MTGLIVHSGYSWFAMRHSSGELLSLKGAVIIHDNPHEYEFLITGARGTVGVPGKTPQEVANKMQRRVMLLRNHPDLSWVHWPLRQEDFWDFHKREFTEKEMTNVRRLMWQSLSQT